MVLGFFITICLTISLFTEYYIDLWYTFTYSTRPLWDTDIDPFTNLIPNYYYEGIDTRERCRLHGWEPRPPGFKKMVVDAFIFSNELDLLDIRLRELYDIVDYFVIVESDYTFMGRPKELSFDLNKDRFAWASKKIRYDVFKGRRLHDGEEPWVLEGDLRRKAAEVINGIPGINGQVFRGTLACVHSCVCVLLIPSLTSIC
jgi:beta-1,4-mannosyl-glycoprotein beta-1,4-N-acetylglucosaminyltransferase